MFRVAGWVVALATAPLAALPLGGQEADFPTPEEYARRAAEAEALPLFQAEEPLKMTLRTDIKFLRDKRPDTMDIEGTLEFVDLDGSVKEIPIEVRTRGNFRRSKRNCNFPPLRLDFPTKRVEGTLFEGQDKLKLVTPCHDSRSAYQDYVLKEYLVYRTYNILTPMSFRVRLVEITYEDVNGEYDTRTKYGFLIEDEEHMAARNRAIPWDVPQFHPARLDGTMSVLASVFAYMIGNTDYSPVFFHNAKLIRTEDGRYVPVPYDFDFSGAVNARYAAPDPKLPIRRVTDRLYRGFCRPELQREWIAELFNDKKDEIWALIEGFTLLDEDEREEMLDFYEDFYEVINDPGKFQREIVRACRSW